MSLLTRSTRVSVTEPRATISRTRAALVLALAVGVTTNAYAVGTAAGTDIQSTATIEFSIGGSATSTTSNTTSVIVAEIVDVSVALQSTTVAVASGAAGATLLYLVTNTGNGAETFALAGDSVLVGDDFDPVPSSPFLYFDTDASGDLSLADIPYVAGANDPALASDASVRVIVVNDIPAGIADGSRGRSELEATAATGTGAAGTIFAGQGLGGVDAVIGTSGGAGAVFGEYLIGDIQVSAVKTQTVADTFGGTRPVPGATITYQIVVTATGSGSARGATFTDAIPPSTTYLPGSMSLNGAALSDGIDADAGRFDSAPAAAVAVTLGDLTASAAPQTIVFRVAID
jgi:uncharacterized repeat protein (TIGR01451 family)